MLNHLRQRGASFTHDIVAACNLDAEICRAALHELVADGLISSDGFAGLRSILVGSRHERAGSRRTRPTGKEGRWFVLDVPASPRDGSAIEMLAWALLRRYGVVFRRLLVREAGAVPWRELVRVYRRLEMRGDIRGGRFVTGMSGEQFALPDAVERLREIRRSQPDDQLITVSAADPLNLVGILTDGERIRASGSGRVVYRNGIAVAAMEGDMLRTLSPVDASIAADVAAAAAGRRVPVLSGYVGRLR